MEINVLIPENEGPEAEGPRSAAQRAVERSLARRRAAVTDEVERLVAATFALIRDTGELEPRVSAIVAAAGLSNQAFYRHFRSKHELLVAALDTGIQELASYLEHRMDKAADPVAAVRAWIRGMLQQALDPEAAAATRPFALARGRLADAYPDEVARTERRLTEPLRAAIAAASAAGRMPGAHPDADAEALYHLCMGWLEARLVERGDPPADSAARLERFALAGLGEPAEEPGRGA